MPNGPTPEIAKLIRQLDELDELDENEPTAGASAHLMGHRVGEVLAQEFTALVEPWLQANIVPLGVAAGRFGQSKGVLTAAAKLFDQWAEQLRRQGT